MKIPRLHWHRRLLAPLLLILIPSVAGTIIFSQTIPPHPTPPKPIVTNLCPNTSQLVGVDNQTLFVGPGAVAWGCTANNAAINIPVTGTVTPSFASLDGYAGFYLIAPPPDGTFTCETGIHLVSGTPVTLPASNYAYCTSYPATATGPFAQIVVTWNQ